MHHASITIGTHDDKILRIVWDGWIRTYANVSIAKASVFELCFSSMRLPKYAQNRTRGGGGWKAHCTPPRLTKSASTHQQPHDRKVSNRNRRDVGTRLYNDNWKQTDYVCKLPGIQGTSTHSIRIFTTPWFWQDSCGSGCQVIG